ncbi:MAG TPA: prepilin-type N-terminal cleavage/methylation domain-containing protein [Nitrospinota bacterium]|nr:prepilin-type N-terminal cleavage/methylation domain-containing protein [Nitrospinota bacterium]
MIKKIRFKLFKLDSKGMTLIEVLIALAVLSIALLAMAMTSLSVIRGNATNDMVTQAATVAQDKMEELKNIPFNNLNSGNDTAGDYTRQWVVTNISATLRQITLTVSWPNRQGGTSTFTVDTLRSE